MWIQKHDLDKNRYFKMKVKFVSKTFFYNISDDVFYDTISCDLIWIITRFKNNINFYFVINSLSNYPTLLHFSAGTVLTTIYNNYALVLDAN